MPAFGVALHNETIESMKKGVWVEFCFDNCVVEGIANGVRVIPAATGRRRFQ